MCGLVGGVGNLSVLRHREMIREMLIYDVVRGHHSTGVAFVKNDMSHHVVKKMGNPFELLDSKEFDNQFTSGQNWAMIGHNRWATKGKVNKANAHPFQFDNVVGAHNGTLRDLTTLMDYRRFEVDSEALMWNIENEGIVDTLPKIRGAFAITVYDQSEETLFIARNSERPMHYCYTEDGKTMFWASEPWMLMVAADRNSIKIGEVFSLEVGHLMKVSRDKGGLKTSFRPFTPWKPQPIVVAQSKPRKKVEFTVDGEEKSKYGSGKYITGTTLCKDQFEVRVHTQENSTLWNLLMSSSQAFEAEVSSDVAQDKGRLYYLIPATVKEIEYKIDDDEPVLFLHPDGRLLDRHEWDSVCTNGCNYCTGPITDEDCGELVLYMGEVICPGCSKNLGLVS